MSKMGWEHAKRQVRPLPFGIDVYHPEDLIKLEIDELTRIKKEVFEYWDEIGAAITLKESIKKKKGISQAIPNSG